MKKDGKKRVWFLLIFCTAVFAAFLVRLYWMQFTMADHYAKKLEQASQTSYTVRIPAARGSIVDRSGTALVQDDTVYDLALCVPAPPDTEMAQTLQTLKELDLGGKDVETQLAAFCSAVSAGELPLAENLTQAQCQSLLAAGLPQSGAVRLTARGTRTAVDGTLAPQLLGAIAIAAYSYMALVPIIQPPIMKLLTTKEEREIRMEQLRPVSKLEKILFPVVVTIVVCMILPTTAPLVGMLMLGNLFRESGVVKQLTETASNALMYIVVILLGTSVGASTSAEAFLNTTTLKIVALGLIAFMFGTAAGVLFGKLLCFLTKGKINPLIGSAGVSAVPMAARVSQKVGSEADPTNFLLMHAMGPNVAGVIGTAVAAGTFMAIFGV